MTPLTRLVVLGVIAWVGLARAAWGQACASSTDSIAVFLRVQLRLMSASTDAEYAAARSAYRVPSVDSTTVVALTQNATCQKILAAFNTAVPGITPVPTRIYAVKVGTVYVALYPTPDTHSWPLTVLDSKYKLLSKFRM